MRVGIVRWIWRMNGLEMFGYSRRRRNEFESCKKRRREVTLAGGRLYRRERFSTSGWPTSGNNSSSTSTDVETCNSKKPTLPLGVSHGKQPVGLNMSFKQIVIQHACLLNSILRARGILTADISIKNTDMGTRFRFLRYFHVYWSTCLTRLSMYVLIWWVMSWFSKFIFTRCS